MNIKNKICTSIEQSQKLVELGIDVNTADIIYKYHTPAWSIAALLSVIPQEIFDGEYVINITEGCDDKWVLTYDNCENRHHSYFGLSSGADNLIDACVEMILKLHEQKLL